MVDLAIIIPAYKEQYLEQTLVAFAKQTNKNFNLYIGDDCSPFNLKDIVDKFRNVLNIKYVRFKDNIGAEKLVNQWKRCINLSTSEKWIWLFSDDDLVDDNCVEAFYSTRARFNDHYDVYRFNTTIIDSNNNEINKMPVGPEFETSAEMAFHLLRGKRGNSMCDHIFSREVYEKNGGIVYTDYAQAADWATSILFSKEKGLVVIDNANFYWRYSGNNISSLAFKSKNKMFLGHLQFIEWVVHHFNYLKNLPDPPITYPSMIKAIRDNLKMVIIHHYQGLDLHGVKLFKYVAKEKLGLSKTEILTDLYEIMRETIPSIKAIINLKNKSKSGIKAIIGYKNG